MLPLNYNNFAVRDGETKRVHLTKNRLKILEESSLFSVSEKVHLLALLIGHQQITDIGLEANDLNPYRQGLQLLDIPFIEESWDDINWLLAGASVALLEYVREKREVLSEVEAGVMYGYPASAALAFTGVMPSRMHRPTSAAAFFLGGVYSVDFYEDELAYYDEVWRKLANLSPATTASAEAEFAKIIISHKS